MSNAFGNLKVLAKSSSSTSYLSLNERIDEYLKQTTKWFGKLNPAFKTSQRAPFQPNFLNSILETPETEFRQTQLKLLLDPMKFMHNP